MRNRWIASLMIAALSLSVFAGCSKKADAPAQEPVQEETAAAEEAAAEPEIA